MKRKEREIEGKEANKGGCKKRREKKTKIREKKSKKGFIQKVGT